MRSINILRKDDSFTVPSPVCEGKETFANPLSRDRETPDPTVIYNGADGYWYGIGTGDKTLTLCRSRKFADIFADESKVIYTASEKDGTYGYLWAPELHFVEGHWYIYTSTRQGENNYGFKHVIILKADTDSPWDGFSLANHINPGILAIDPTVAEIDGQLYIIFSVVDGGQQKLAIQKLENPYTASGEFTVIAQACYDWEKIMPLNEGPFVVQRDGRVFIIYSGNGCWNNEYLLGIIELTGEDPMKAESWSKYDTPFMTMGNGNYGPGHAAFFESPDGTELWVCFHTLKDSNPAASYMPRYCSCQRVYFDGTGFPHVGMLIPKGAPIPVPSRKQ